MGIFKCVKNALSTPIQWHNFCSCFLNIVMRRNGEETQNYPNISFSHNFCHWFFQKTWKILSVVFSRWPFWINLKTCINHALRQSFMHAIYFTSSAKLIQVITILWSILSFNSLIATLLLLVIVGILLSGPSYFKF